MNAQESEGEKENREFGSKIQMSGNPSLHLKYTKPFNATLTLKKCFY